MFDETYVYDDGEVFYVWENAYDEESHAVDVEINFFVNDNNNKYERITEIQRQYIHKTEDLVCMLKEVGFTEIEIYDDYNDEIYEYLSLRAVFCATKSELVQLKLNIGESDGCLNSE